MCWCAQHLIIDWWSRGQVDPDQARRSVLKAGAVTAGVAAVGGPAAVRGVRGLITKAATPIVARSAILTGFGAGISKFITQVRRANADQVEIDLAALIVDLMSFRVSLSSIVDKMLFK